MNKIKQHYDKVILACLLVLFILTLVFQLFTSKIPTAVGGDTISRIENLSADYVPLKTADSQLLAIVTNLPYAKQWIPGAQFVADGSATDFMFVPEIARCGSCLGLIFFHDYEVKKCSRCGVAISAEQIINVGRDSDKDGIPDVVELAIGTDPKVADAHLDIDGDGFSNLDEYLLAKASGDWSSITDPKKHPPLNCFLALKDVKERKLDIVLTSVSTSGRPDPKDWRIYTKIDNKSKTISVGQTIPVGDVSIRIDSARNDPPPGSKPGAAPVPRVRATIVGRSDAITLIKGQEVFDPKPAITFSYNQYADKPAIDIATTLGGKFRIGSDLVGWEEVEVVGLSPDKKVAKIKSLGYNVDVTAQAARPPYSPVPASASDSDAGTQSDGGGILDILRN